jgi:hypothetical protein
MLHVTNVTLVTNVTPLSCPRKARGNPSKCCEIYQTKMEFEMYEEAKRLAKILTKVGNFLQGQHPEILRTMEKNELV